MLTFRMRLLNVCLTHSATKPNLRANLLKCILHPQCRLLRKARTKKRETQSAGTQVSKFSESDTDGGEKTVPWNLQLVRETFPYLLSIGMTAEQYWDGDFTLVSSYLEGHKLALQRKTKMTTGTHGCKVGTPMRHWVLRCQESSPSTAAQNIPTNRTKCKTMNAKKNASPSLKIKPSFTKAGMNL